MRTFVRNNAIVTLTELQEPDFFQIWYEKYIIKDGRTYLVDTYSYIDTPIDKVIEILIQNGYTDITLYGYTEGDQYNV